MQCERGMGSTRRGFTLVEIIVVLAALGVLALAAIPKYMDLTVKARNRAAQGVISEIKGRCSLIYARQLLHHQGDGSAITAAKIARELGTHPEVGEGIRVVVRADGPAVAIQVVEVDGAKVDVQGSYTLPGSR